MDSSKSFFKKHKIDLIIVIVSFALCLSSCLGLYFYSSSKKESKIANVYLKNEIILSIDLSKEKQEREINTSGTHGEMKLGVKKDYICVKESSCPHKYCINQGYTSSFPIVCSFNDITIKIESSSPYEVIL